MWTFAAFKSQVKDYFKYGRSNFQWIQYSMGNYISNMMSKNTLDQKYKCALYDKDEPITLRL